MAATRNSNGKGEVRQGSSTAAAAADDKDDNDRDTAYFQYYALLSHQAQMLQDSIRTSSYQKAILSNSARCFQGKVVMDVGAGNGILSLFAAQAGASKVYAIEASQMVDRLQHLISSASGSARVGAASGSKDETVSALGTALNAWIGDRVVPVQSKMEDVGTAMLDGNTQVDTIVSECLGVLLVHERMCESFLDARDRFLKPGGTMLPSSGTICLAPFEDKLVWDEAANKARFWENHNFYGVDITPLAEAAWDESFSSPVVGCFGSLIILAPSNDYSIDFQTISQEDLKRFTIPLSFDIGQAAIVHGLAGWFDLHFLPPMFGTSASEEGDAALRDFEMASVEGGGGAAAAAAAGTAQASATSPTGDLQTFNDVQSLLGSSANTIPGGGNAFIPGSAIEPATSSSYMSTSPFATPTHWQQVRFLFREPLAVNKGQRIEGTMLCQVNDFRSYTLTAELRLAGATDDTTIRHCQWRLDRQVYSWTSAAPAPQ